MGGSHCCSLDPTSKASVILCHLRSYVIFVLRSAQRGGGMSVWLRTYPRKILAAFVLWRMEGPIKKSQSDSFPSDKCVPANGSGTEYQGFFYSFV